MLQNPLILSLLAAALIAGQFTLTARLLRIPSGGMGPFAHALCINSVKGLSFVLLLTPVFYFIHFEISSLFSGAVFGVLSAAIFFSCLGDWVSARATQLCKVGVVMTVFQNTIALTALGYGMFFFDERLTLVQILGVFGLVLCMFIVGGSDSNERGDIRSALIFAFFAGILCGLGNFYFGQSSKLIGMWGATLGWQSGMGLFSGLMLLGGRVSGRIQTPVLLSLSPKLLGMMLLFTSPCVIGVLFFSKAQEIGDIGVTNVVVTAGVKIFVSVFSVFLLGEHLRMRQWGGILLSCLSLWLVCG